MTPLLLHVCCGPCSLMPVRQLRKAGYEPVGWFHNPNIQPLGEYLKRREAAGECAARLDLDLEYDDASWNLQEWLNAQLPHANSKTRCERCCSMRLEQAAKKSQEKDIGCFSTTLLYSRYQPHEFIRRRGEELGSQYGLEFIYDDFRAFWQEGIDLSRELGIYRQAWCGCIFSEAERYQKKLTGLKKS